MRIPLRFTVAVMVLFGSAETTLADNERPWAKGVSAETQTTALTLFNEGNSSFEKSQYVPALTKYREALKHWEHPAIHFNVTVCLINLGKEIEAFEHLEKALAFGDSPLGAKAHADAVTYRKLLLGQLARLTVKTKEGGAKVTLDGEPLHIGSATTNRVLRPGKHQILAKKTGYLTYTRDLNLPAGQLTSHEVTMVLLSDATVFERRWATQLPWTIIGGGVAVAALGAGTHFLASSNFKQYDRDIAIQCPQGCLVEEIPGAVSSTKSRAELQNVLAIGLYAAGGATIVAGLAMAIMNQARPVESRADTGPTLTPSVGPNQASISFAIPFY